MRRILFTIGATFALVMMFMSSANAGFVMGIGGIGKGYAHMINAGHNWVNGKLSLKEVQNKAKQGGYTAHIIR